MGLGVEGGNSFSYCLMASLFAASSLFASAVRTTSSSAARRSTVTPLTHPPLSWVRVRRLTTAKASASDPSFWPPHGGGAGGELLEYDWEEPTNVVYWDREEEAPSSSSPSSSSSSQRNFAPAFSEARGRLDYSYHHNLLEKRQLLQDAILGRVVAGGGNGVARDDDDSATSSASAELKSDDDGTPTTTTAAANGREAGGRKPRRPWIVFTAGPMGVGKGYALTQLSRAGAFPLGSFLKIDPDMLKSELPEMAGYLRRDRSTAATKLHRESTQMADVLFEHALRLDMPVLVDGSLRDVSWYRRLFGRIRTDHPEYRIAILHVTADADVIRMRAADRAAYSGRAVPSDVLNDSIRRVPESVRLLSECADAVHVVANNDGSPLELVASSTSGADRELSWRSFAESWDRGEGEEEHQSAADTEEETRVADAAGGLILEQRCDLAKLWVDEEAQSAALDAWGAAYPNFCARCCLTCDCQCGICIHGRHSCACPLCKEGGGGGGGDDKEDAAS